MQYSQSQEGFDAESPDKSLHTWRPKHAWGGSHRMMLDAGGISISTLDGAQGKELNFVILDMVTPGGRAHELGFDADPKCLSSSQSSEITYQLTFPRQTVQAVGTLQSTTGTQCQFLG